ncbi:MAG: hypothetical protein GWN56_01640, partial [Nitrosopumilaceae archaeon]|nr:hypothetical protein [Nitrosopumilaceae archaeon]NIV64797.1 hypothetical protein [Nitrosopumilaceae archaeon]
MERVNITINGTDLVVIAGKSIMEVAESSEIYIPRLCSHPDLVSAQGLNPVESVYQGTVHYKTDNS